MKVGIILIQAASSVYDVTTAYIASLPFSVDVVTPKYQFLSSPLPTNICNIPLLDFLAQTLNLDSFDLGLPFDVTSILPMADATTERTRTTLNFRDFLDNVHDELDREEPGRNRMAADQQLRGLILAGTIFAALPGITKGLENLIDSPKLLNMAQEEGLYDVVAILDKRNAIRKRYTDHADKSCETGKCLFGLSNYQCDCDCESSSGKECDCTNAEVAAACPCCGGLNGVPDQLVGALGSRTFGNLLAGLATDNLSAGMRHASAMKSLGDVICEANQHGLATDFKPDWTPCVLDALATYLVSCLRQTSTGSCDSIIKDTTPNLSTCDYPIAWQKDPIDLLTLNSSIVVENNQLIDPQDQNDLAFGEQLKADRRTMYAYWKAIKKQYAITSQQECAMKNVTEDFIRELLPGWPIVHEVWLLQENSNYVTTLPVKASPFTIVSKKKSTKVTGECEFLISTRGSKTDVDWHINLMFEQIPIPGFPSSVMGHSGYIKTALPVAESILNLLHSEYFSAGIDSPNYCRIDTTTVHLTGHSLGGGMANMLGLLLGSRLKSLDSRINIHVNAVASLRVFNALALDHLRIIANVRNFRYALDIVPTMPCLKTGVPRCDPRTYGVFPGEGIEKPFVENLNLVIIRPKEDLVTLNETLMKAFTDSLFLNLPDMSDSLEVPSTQCAWYINIPAPLQFASSHMCSYGCFFSSRGCSTLITKQEQCYSVTTASGLSCYVTKEKYESIGGKDKYHCHQYGGERLPPWSLNGRNDTLPASIDCEYDRSIAAAIPNKCGLMAGLSGPKIWKMLWPVIKTMSIKPLLCLVAPVLCRDVENW